MSFVIMNHPDFDILLGLNWFNITGTGISQKTREITFPETRLTKESTKD